MGLIWDLKEVPKHVKHSKNKAHAQELRKQYDTQSKETEEVLENAN